MGVDTGPWNSGERLRHFLIDLMHTWSQREGDPLVTVLGSTFGDPSPHVLAARVADLAKLPRDVLDELHFVGSSHIPAVKEALLRIERGFAPSALFANFRSSGGWLNDASVIALHTAAIELQGHRSTAERLLPDGVLILLSGYIGDAKSLLETDSALPADLRLLLFELLDRVASVIARYQIVGAKGLERLLDEMAGRTRRDSRLGKRQRQLSPGWVAALLVFNVASNAVQFAADATTVRDSANMPWSNIEVPLEVQNCLSGPLELGPGAIGELPAGATESTG
jgi:hypothetical protein